jgi:hypothetical protein
MDIASLVDRYFRVEYMLCNERLSDESYELLMNEFDSTREQLMAAANIPVRNVVRAGAGQVGGTLVITRASGERVELPFTGEVEHGSDAPDIRS